MLERIHSMWADEDGVTTVEYAMLLALLVVAALGIWTTFGTIVRGKIAAAGNSVNGIG